MNVCVVGAGAIGSLYAAHLARVADSFVLTRRAEHAAAYFATERRMERPDGPWTGFQEGERTIDGQRYATMSFQLHPNASAEHVMDGLFLVYFPQDFEQRQRFYVFMWSDLHPKATGAHGTAELRGAVLAAAPVGRFGSPCAPLAGRPARPR